MLMPAVNLQVGAMVVELCYRFPGAWRLVLNQKPENGALSVPQGCHRSTWPACGFPSTIKSMNFILFWIFYVGSM